MPYSAEISRRNPTCFVFLIDQSESMIRPIAGGEGKSKAQGVTDAINSLLRNLIFASTTGTGLANRFHIGVIGYGKSVGSALLGPLSGRLLVPISDLADNPLRIHELKDWIRAPSGVMVEKKVRRPIWIEPRAMGKTPMCEALEQAGQVVAEFIEANAGCFPPTVVNITDGQATDGDPLATAEALQMLFSEDGNVLLFNIHLSESEGDRLLYPSWIPMDAGPSTTILFEMSSPLPASYLPIARKIVPLNDGARGFAFNADMNSLVQFLNIGTQSTFA